MSEALLFLVLVIATPLVVNEVGELAPWLARHLLRWGARRLGDELATERYREEWLADLDDVPGKLTKLGHSLVVVAWSVPVMRGRHEWRRLEAARRDRRVRRLVTTWTPVMWHVARGRGLARDAAEEVVCDVWSTYWLQRLRPWRVDRRVGEWLVTRTRELTRDKVVADPTGLEPARSPLDSREAALWQAFTSLPRADQELLRLAVLVSRMNLVQRKRMGAVLSALPRPRDRRAALHRLRRALSAGDTEVVRVDGP
ncbi:hypothetical protein SUDANB95_03553 [Actinosynnema sp. ALI-1.44]